MARKTINFLALIILLLAAHKSQAILVQPSGEPYLAGKLDPVRAPHFPYVGCFPNEKGQSTSLVYLGGGRVLTAWHAFKARSNDTAWIDGKIYSLDLRQVRRLSNPEEAGLNSNADLVLLQLKNGPKMVPISVSNYSPFVGEKIVMIGFGARRNGDTLIEGTSKNTIGYPTSSEPGDYRNGPTWGENYVSAIGLRLQTTKASGDIFGFSTTFDFNDLSLEAQVAPGDSGGAIFIERGNHWDLAGIIYASSSNAANEIVYGSVSYAADLSVYAPQISGQTPIALSIPEPERAVLLMFGFFLLFSKRKR